VVDALELKDVKYMYKPVEHGIGWRGDVKNIALSIDKVKGLGFRPKLSSTEAVRKTALLLKREILRH